MLSEVIPLQCLIMQYITDPSTLQQKQVHIKKSCHYEQEYFFIAYNLNNVTLFGLVTQQDIDFKTHFFSEGSVF